MASELSQLIESELRKAEGANKPDEHQKRLASLRVKTGVERPPPGLVQRVCTTKRQIVAAAVVIALVLILIVVGGAAHRHHRSGQGSEGLQSASDTLQSTTQMPYSAAVNRSQDSQYDVMQSVQSDEDLSQPAPVAELEPLNR